MTTLPIALPLIPATRSRAERLPERVDLTDGPVTVRRFTPDDIDRLVALMADPEVRRFHRLPAPEAEAVAVWLAMKDEEWRRGTAVNCAALNEGVAVGRVGFRDVDLPSRSVQLACWLVSAGRGRGTASRAVRLLCGWAFDLGVVRVMARPDADNVAARRMLELCGFTLEGVLRSWGERDGQRIDKAVYSLLVDDVPQAAGFPPAAA
jgi:RimJ/RimL family protein N-acetyltransferase